MVKATFTLPSPFRLFYGTEVHNRYRKQRIRLIYKKFTNNNIDWNLQFPLGELIVSIEETRSSLMILRWKLLKINVNKMIKPEWKARKDEGLIGKVNAAFTNNCL